MDTPLEWINVRAVPDAAPGTRVALFGAGNGSRELLRHWAGKGGSPEVVAVLDNNPTLQGHRFQSLPIMDPARLPELDVQLVIVTTVSGAGPVSEQLQTMGLRQERDFVLVGRYPTAGCIANLRSVVRLLDQYGKWPEQSFLHVGPGGFFGLECALLALSPENAELRGVAVDAYAFDMHWPDVTLLEDRYAQVRDLLPELARELHVSPKAALERWDALFTRQAGRLLLESNQLKFAFPHRFSCLPEPDGSQDVVCSFAVLEHVRAPERAVAETRRILRPGGVAVMQVTTQDHRSFGVAGDHTPISYRRHSEEEWETITANTFYQNRLAPFQWRELFEAQGFRMLEYRVLKQYVAPKQELDELHPDFRGWSREQQQEMDCLIVAARD
ncbi:Methyltransferase domain-containing protein [Paucidesulfovibrio gracilis DSM 16080]|uniref:Methyltransferase domain-containing protein n=1 Tax=Paucidesulfovibrio gracilis DSM 16080 TaxID=1121449 RepID=A0A1T4X1W7_9BACT|nr:methyltransferase domain-containing protein [Paucidesulfovibrio gracilis]SKA83065.1 Methyltransferase domain-containing protein [Paucidesulfovibrio gracilis DSM 16080]